MLKKILMIAGLLGAGLAHAYMPQNGTWVVTSELNGKPGRGLAMDAQNGTLVMQMYAYESNGQSTFYLASGALADNKFSAPLMRYQGGRYFGSGARTGTEAGSPGNVSVRFTSGVSGFITFPGEPEVAISRFNFGYPFEPSSLKGVWIFTSLGSEGIQADAALLEQEYSASATGNGLLAAADGTFGCEHQISGNLAGGVLCAKVSTSGQLLRSYWFTYSVNEGEGVSLAGATSSQQTLVVRRLTTPQGVGTGIAYKSANGAAPASVAALYEQMSRLVQGAVLRPH